ncbi:MAG: 3',5'-cyclic-AMP phosphodiesterase [Oleiphilaceae bacterium]|nr:3',5'-cyclic-AMP phosphodiesterase [Oleiphilaceae bacterium]
MHQKDYAVKVLHITDCHLNADRSRDLLGINTFDSLNAVLNDIKADGQQPDCILVTGDISQDGSVEAYQTMKEMLSDFTCPIRWFAGNHDARSNMSSVIGEGEELQKTLVVGDWEIILLDSLSPGNVHGELSDSELNVLETSLASSSANNTMVCLHHHPIPIGAKWLDNIGLHRPEAFLDAVSKDHSVKAVLWGHIHQEFDQSIDGKRWLASPSTCIQFKPQSEDFALDKLAPGYRWLTLHSDGSFETEVKRANEFEFELDLQSNGY